MPTSDLARWPLRLALAATLALLLAGAACAAPQPPAPRQDQPTASARALTVADGGQGGVTVEATWVTAGHLAARLGRAPVADYPLDRYVLVHLTLDTHSVDLAGYDLRVLASLKGQGLNAVAAVAWVSIEESGHHRDGLLAFPGAGQEWERQGRRAELTLTGIAGVERVLRWGS